GVPAAAAGDAGEDALACFDHGRDVRCAFAEWRCEAVVLHEVAGALDRPPGVTAVVGTQEPAVVGAGEQRAAGRDAAGARGALPRLLPAAARVHPHPDAVRQGDAEAVVVIDEAEAVAVDG